MEARTAALEASVSAAAGVTLTKTGANSGTSTGSADVNGALDLAALLGVEDGASKDKFRKGSAVQGSSNTGNNQINMQMINILQSQRDQYKDKLTRVRSAAVLIFCRISHNHTFLFLR